MLSILLVSRDVSLFADIFLRLGLKKIGHEFKQDSVDLQIFFGEIVRGGRWSMQVSRIRTPVQSFQMLEGEPLTS